MKYTFDQIKRHIKLSKSDQRDNGPYSVEQAKGGSWYEIYDRSGALIGQTNRLPETVTEKL